MLVNALVTIVSVDCRKRIRGGRVEIRIERRLVVVGGAIDGGVVVVAGVGRHLYGGPRGIKSG